MRRRKEKTFQFDQCNAIKKKTHIQTRLLFLNPTLSRCIKALLLLKKKSASLQRATAAKAPAMTADATATRP